MRDHGSLAAEFAEGRPGIRELVVNDYQRLVTYGAEKTSPQTLRLAFTSVFPLEVRF